MISFNIDLFNLFQFIFNFLKKLLSKYKITVKELIITEFKLLHASFVISMFLVTLEHYLI